MGFLLDMPIFEIDRCLRVLKNTVCNESELRFLIQCKRHHPDYKLAICLINDCLLDLIRQGKLCRWDFDPGDKSHRFQDKIIIRSGWRPPPHWKSQDKRRLVYDIVGCFRQSCHVMTEEVLSALENVSDCDELREVEKMALKKGILQQGDRAFIHNPSIIHSKHVFEACMRTYHRLNE